MREALHAAPSEPHSLVLDAEGVSHVDSAGRDAIDDLVRRLPVTVYAARVKSPVRSHLHGALAADRVHPTVRAAVAAAVRAAEPHPGCAPR